MASTSSRAAAKATLHFQTPARRWVPPTVFKVLEPLTGKRKVRERLSLYEQLATLPGQGVGMRVYKRKWREADLPVGKEGGCYWHIVKTEFDTRHRKNEEAVRHVWGIKYWHGKQQTPAHTIVQVEDPDESWEVVGDGADSRSFYRDYELQDFPVPDFGTDPATAKLMNPPAPREVESDPIELLGEDPQVSVDGFVVQPEELDTAKEQVNEEEKR